MNTAGLSAEHVLAFVLLGLAVIVAVARVVGNVFVRFGQPRVVGEIVAGVLLGPTLLGPTLWTWADPPAWLACERSLAPSGATPSLSTCLFPPQARGVLAVLGQIGLVLFMFLVGLVFDARLLRGRWAAVVGVGVGVVAVPVAAAFALAPVLFGPTFVAGYGTPAEPSALAFTLLVGAMLAVTAFPVTARILQDKGLLESPIGTLAIGSAAVVTVLMFLVVAAGRGAVSGAGAGTHVARLAGVTAYLVVVVGGLAPLLRRLAPRVLAPGTLTGGWFATGIVFVLLSAYTTDRLGVTVIPGAFLAGAVIPRAVREQLGRQFEVDVERLTLVVLLPVFLAVSGLQTDFTKLGWDALAPLTLLVVVAVATKWLGGAACARLGGLGWRDANTLGVLMNCRGLLVLVVGLIGLDAGVFTPAMQVGGVLMALVTTAMTGPLVDRLLVAPDGPAGATR